MNVVYTNAFKKDLLKLKNARLKQKLKTVLLNLEKEESLKDIGNCIKVKGHPSAYRIRIGEYRLGFYFNDNKIGIARFLKRNDIYKLFP